MIDVKKLTKRYGSHLAVDDLTFHVEKGSVYGFLGPNGAGKSTTMNILTGSLAATSGDVSIAGYDIYENAREIKRIIGYLPEQPPLYMDCTPKEYLTFVGNAKGFYGIDLKHQMEQVMEFTKIADVSNRLIKNLSKGYRQRVGIAQAILGNPKVIILDEPTVGLDPLQIIEIRDLIKSLGHSHTVILSSHILSEVQAVCNRVLIISQGKLVACDTYANLEKQFLGEVKIEMEVEGKKDEIAKLLGNIVAEEVTVRQSGKTCAVTIGLKKTNEDICRNLFWLFADVKIPILRMYTAQTSLEDVFIELTRRSQMEDRM